MWCRWTFTVPSASLSRRPISLFVIPSESTSMIWRSRAVSGACAGVRLNLAFGAGTTASYVANQAGTGGTLSVTDGVHTANITLLGQYDPAGFQTEADKT